MTKRDRRALGRYVRALADDLELRDWTFEVMRDPCEPANHATVEVVYGRKLARIFFNEDFRGYELDRQRHVVAHELVHCHLESACSMVRSDLEPHLPSALDQVFWHGFKRQIEYGVDGLASALAKHLPLIEWPEAKR